MIDSVIKILLFCAVPALIDHWVYRATGVPLNQSLSWWLRNIGSAPWVVLGFGSLIALTFAGGVYGIVKDFYQSLISTPQIGLFLGYHDLKEHYLLTDGGQARQVSLYYPGPGVFHLDSVYQPRTVMHNPVSGLYWPLKETRGEWVYIMVAAISLLFALAAFGNLHVMYMQEHVPDLLANTQGKLYKTELTPYFMKSLFSWASLNPMPFVVAGTILVGGLMLQAQRLKSESSRLVPRPVPAAIKPGAVLTATLADTYFNIVTGGKERLDGSGSSKQTAYYFAIFEISGLYPHTVWVVSRLGSDSPADKDDDYYSTLEDEFEKRTEYENARPLFNRLKEMTASHPQMRVKIAEDLSLDWTVEPSLALETGSASNDAQRQR